MEIVLLQAERDKPRRSNGGCMSITVMSCVSDTCVQGPCTHSHACVRPAGSGCMGPFRTCTKGLAIALRPLCIDSCCMHVRSSILPCMPCCAQWLMPLGCPAAEMPALSHAVQGTATPQNSACSISSPATFAASGLNPLLAPPASCLASLAAPNKMLLLLLLLLLSSSNPKGRLRNEQAMEASKFLVDVTHC